jgi:hypothetical protein
MIAVGGGCIPNREEANRPASIIPCAEEGSPGQNPAAKPDPPHHANPQRLGHQPHPPAWPRAGTGPG